MNWNFLFFMNSALLGVGLAMDAFSVSLANGMNEKKMKKSRMAYIAGVYAFFQFLHYGGRQRTPKSTQLLIILKLMC